MTSNLLEKLQVYFLSHAVTRYFMIYFGNSSKIKTSFKNKSCNKKSDFENLKILFLIHGLLKYLSEKRIKNWGH